MKPFNYLAYIWKVECEDGTVLMQFDDKGEHRISEINLDTIRKFTWIPTREGLIEHFIDVAPGQKINCFRKNFLGMLSGTHTVAFAIGIHGQPLKWIFEDEVQLEEL